MPRYKACLFDLDGTLVDTLSSIAYFGNGALAAFGLPAIETAAYRRLVGNGGDVPTRGMREPGGPQPPPGGVQLRRPEYDRRYEDDPLALAGPYPGLPEVLGRLHRRGMRLGVLSNKPDNMACYVARAFYGDVLSQVRGQREGCPQKPDPAAALEMAARWGLRPQEVLYVGDSGVDMETGKNAGMDTCGVLWGFRGEAELAAHGAKHLAGDPGQLEMAAMGRFTQLFLKQAALWGPDA